MAEKNRYWTAVCYPENMLPGWEQKIDRILQLPYAYCKHDLDHDKKSEHRKDHVHIVVAWGNTTTGKHALETFNRLSAPGRICCSFCESVIGIRYIYEYLIHNTEGAKKEGKEIYPASARITGNGFDIGAYEQLSAKEKSDALRELCELIIEKKYQNFADFYCYAMYNEQYEDAKYWEAFKTYSGLLERLCKGNYQKYNPKAK